MALPLVAGGRAQLPGHLQRGVVAVAPGFSLADNDHKVRVCRSLASPRSAAGAGAFAVDPGVGLTTTMPGACR